MKALFQKEWKAFLKENIAYLFVGLIAYLLICSLSWITVIDCTLIIYALQVSPVLSMIQACSDKWRSYEMFLYTKKQRILFRYALSAIYAFTGAALVLMLSHEILPALCAFFLIFYVPSLCTPVYMAKNTSKGLLIGVLVISSLLCLPGILLLDAYVSSLQLSAILHTESQALLYPQYTLLPAAVLSAAGLLISLFTNGKD